MPFNKPFLGLSEGLQKNMGPIGLALLTFIGHQQKSLKLSFRNWENNSSLQNISIFTVIRGREI